MPKREKTTRAEHRSIRLNPVTSREDRDVLKIIHDLEKQGYNFKQIAVDAILRADGKTPEMYSRSYGADLLGGIESLLERFMRDISSQLRRGEIGIEDIASNEGDVSPFMQNFTKSFMERQRQKE